MVAFSNSQGEEPHDQYRGWHLVRPRNWVFRYCREDRDSAFSLSLTSQYCSTAALTKDLKCSFLGGESSHVMGWGSSYWRQSILNLQNQDLVLAEEEEKIDLALAAKTSFPFLSLQTCPNMENNLRWSWAWGLERETSS